jgi:L-histidine N-alpha-methyltransferase
MIEQFKKDVDAGLSAVNKSLSSKYFYDKKGDALFVEIMHSDEYYLTRAELEIFQNQTSAIIDSLNLSKESYFELVELGAGDGLKTKELLRSLANQNYTFDYFPIDISQNALDQLKHSLKTELPQVAVEPKQGDYLKVLESLKQTKNQKVILFLGSNIGNMTDGLAATFMEKLSDSLAPGDKLLLGVDLIKSKEVVLPAYNDSKGFTRAFNLNLLDRINQELGGDFVVENFKHAPEYSESEGIAKSYLVSTINQEAKISSLQKTFRFEAGEKIFMEISRKYNDEIISYITRDTQLRVIAKFTDSKGYFANYVFSQV